MTLVKGNSAKEINTSLLSIQKEVDDINRKLDTNIIISGSNNNDDIKIDTTLNGNSKNAIANSAVYNALNIEATTRESQDSYLNEEIDKLRKEIFLIAHPVGSYWSTSDTTDPNVKYGGTWEKITGKFLYAADNDTPVGSTGGSKTNTLTVDNLPSHSHSFTPKGSLNSTGAHTHTRGTMNITSDVGDSNFLSIWTTGTSMSDVTETFKNSPLYYESLNGYEVQLGNSGSFGRLKFDASRNWTGSTSSNGSHTHTFTGTKGNTENTGSAEAVNNMPPYLACNTWHRIS